MEFFMPLIEIHDFITNLRNIDIINLVWRFLKQMLFNYVLPYLAYLLLHHTMKCLSVVLLEILMILLIPAKDAVPFLIIIILC